MSPAAPLTSAQLPPPTLVAFVPDEAPVEASSPTDMDGPPPDLTTVHANMESAPSTSMEPIHEPAFADPITTSIVPNTSESSSSAPSNQHNMITRSKAEAAEKGYLIMM
ncbi:hypothetical protein V6N11_051531 [Hibiscus sabdariffa]|uniref:Uncharacterized protein n=1 Tax=Hibiscus sabdariffa TaxID=183260 RepID=A0ABR2U834_9ROSI